MKTEDFERLKKLCDENGFELVTESPNDNDKFFVVRKKDKWGGVEFVEVLSADIRQISEIEVDHNGRKRIWNTTGSWAFDYECKPSTEQAYVEQLKKEAFERFGAIKEGDRFMSVDGKKYEIEILCITYDKQNDALKIHNLIIYQKGKWAERVKERVEVKCSGYSYESDDNREISIYFDLSRNHEILNKKLSNVSEFLASQLEKYLNNEIE